MWWGKNAECEGAEDLENSSSSNDSLILESVVTLVFSKSSLSVLDL